MELPFGKKVMCGSFYVVKRTRSLSSKELKRLRAAQGVPKEIQKHLQRATLPYIIVSTVSDSWRIEFVVGMTMFDAINEIPVAVTNDGTYTYYGNAAINLGNVINGWFAYTSTVGDDRYQADCILAMQDYLYRHSENELTSVERQKEFEKAKSVVGEAMGNLSFGYDDDSEANFANLMKIYNTIRSFISKSLVNGQNKNPLAKEEAAKVMKESEEKEKNRATIIDMGKEILNNKDDGKVK